MDNPSTFKAPAHKSTTVRGSYMSDDPAGVEGGISSRKDFDSEVSSDFKIAGTSAKNGYARECVGKKESYSASEKGHSFDIGC